MTEAKPSKPSLAFFAVLLACATVTAPARSADHNDPNGVNSIFADVGVSAADLYGMFGFPSDDTSDGEKVVIALTFASIPRTGGDLLSFGTSASAT